MKPSIPQALSRLGMLGQFTEGRAALIGLSWSQAEAWFAEFRARVKAQYLLLAHAAHPDRGGSKAAMQEINAAWVAVKNLRMTPLVPQPQITIIRITTWRDRPFAEVLL